MSYKQIVMLRKSRKLQRDHSDRASRDVVRQAIDFFEHKDLAQIQKEEQEMIWADQVYMLCNSFQKNN